MISLTTPPFEITPPSSRPLRLLVIDDEEMLREALQLLLEHSGHQVLTAADGRQGCAVARAEEPDLILCDITMPGMTGHEVLDALQADAQTKHIPFIFLTGCNEARSIRTGMASGATDYLLKPFRLDEIKDAIANCLRKVEWMQRDDETEKIRVPA